MRTEIRALRAEMHAASSEMLLKLFFGMVASNATSSVSCWRPSAWGEATVTARPYR